MPERPLVTASQEPQSGWVVEADGTLRPPTRRERLQRLLWWPVHTFFDGLRGIMRLLASPYQLLTMAIGEALRREHRLPGELVYGYRHLHWESMSLDELLGPNQGPQRIFRAHYYRKARALKVTYIDTTQPIHGGCWMIEVAVPIGAQPVACLAGWYHQQRLEMIADPARFAKPCSPHLRAEKPA